MFNQANLHKHSTAGGFTVWFYDAGQNGSAARNMLGFFPVGAIADGDAIYIRDHERTTHHWAQLNRNENRLAMWSF